MIVDVINPKTGKIWHVDVPIHHTIWEAAKRDLPLSLHVMDLARPHLPPGFMLLGGGLRTP